MDPSLLEILCCPENHMALSLAEPALVEQMNRLIQDRRLSNRAGQPVTEPLEGLLLRADHRFAYPIRQGIPILLVDEAIPLTLAPGPEFK